MVSRENKNNAYAKFGGTNKEYYGIFRTGLFKFHLLRFLLRQNEEKTLVLTDKNLFRNFNPILRLRVARKPV